MANITITMKDGEVKKFPHEGRPGGSYTKKVRYEGAFVVITDEWGKEIAIPAEDVKQVEVEPNRY